MNVRPFDWRDLPTLHRYRHQGLFLDSVWVFTRRPSLVPTNALLTYFAPATGIFTYLVENEAHSDEPLVGQVTHATGAVSAHISFLAPEEPLEPILVSAIMERMCLEVGERGGQHILAEVYEHHHAFEVLRQLGFAIYARQRFWQLNIAPALKAVVGPWRPCIEKDLPAIRSLYSNLVPGLVQQVEPPPSNHLRGWVYLNKQDLLGYIELKYGPQGILAQPFIHPDAEELAAGLVPLLENLPDRRGRPIYLCVRTYQSWLESALYDTDAQPSPRQAVMVKRLVLTRRAEQVVAIPILEGGRAEPIARICEFPIEPRLLTIARHLQRKSFVCATGGSPVRKKS